MIKLLLASRFIIQCAFFYLYINIFRQLGNFNTEGSETSPRSTWRSLDIRFCSTLRQWLKIYHAKSYCITHGTVLVHKRAERNGSGNKPVHHTQQKIACFQAITHFFWVKSPRNGLSWGSSPRAWPHTVKDDSKWNGCAVIIRTFKPRLKFNKIFKFLRQT